MKESINDLSKEERNRLISQIEFNIAEEAKASQFYFELKNLIPEEDQSIINGIIGDELDHLITLSKLQERYSYLYPNSYKPLLNLPRKDEKS